MNEYNPRNSLYSYFRNKYPDDEKIDEEYCDELSYYPNTKEYLDFINDLRILLNDKKISNWYDDDFEELCNIFNTPDDKTSDFAEAGDRTNNIYWIIHGFWESMVYPGIECLPSQLLNDFKEILENDGDIGIATLWNKYEKIKHQWKTNL